MIRAPAQDVFRYEPRQIVAEPVVHVHGWAMKPYRIASGAPGASAAVKEHNFPGLLASALHPSTDPRNHGPGFAIVHQGRDGAYLLIGRWHAGHNLASDTYRIADKLDGTVRLVPLELFACIWEMAVYAFERDAWVATTMKSGAGEAGVDAYLACRIEGYV